LIGLTDADFSPEEDAQRFFHDEQRLFDTGQTVQTEELAHNEFGEEVWFTVTKVPLYDSSGKITRMLGINTDISSRKRLEDHLRYHAELIDNIDDAVISTDMELRIVSWNRGAERMYEWTAAEVVGGVFREFIKQEFFNNATRESILDMAIKNGSWSGEFVQYKRGGEAMHVLSVISLITDNQGTAVGLVAVNRDVTELKQAEQQQVELTVERERVKILRQVISDMSHDLKNPLATIRTSLYLLERFADDPSKRKVYLEALDGHASRLDTMLQDLLSMSRLENATDAISFVPVDLCALLRQVVQDQLPLAVHRHQALVLEDGPPIPSMTGDPVQLSRAITNLVVNALNYTPEGGQVTLAVRHDASQLVLEVRDTGIGISTEDQAHIFDRFYRADKSRSSATGGSGLGLAITTAIVETHGGSILVESVHGKGSVFRISLPRMAQSGSSMHRP
jgi:PAS domain S-box-containing protein